MKNWLVDIDLIKFKEALESKDKIQFTDIIQAIDHVINSENFRHELNDFNSKMSDDTVFIKSFNLPILTIITHPTWADPSCYDILDDLICFLAWFTDSNIISQSYVAYIREPLYKILNTMQNKGELMVC